MNLRIPTMTRDFRVDLDPTHHQLFHLVLDFFACQVELPQHVHGLLTTATMRTRADLTPDQCLLVLFQNTPDHPESLLVGSGINKTGIAVLGSAESGVKGSLLKAGQLIR